MDPEWTASELRIDLFGRVRAWRGSREVPLGPHQQRAMLALLALAEGDPVSIDELVAAYWQEPPPSAINTLRTYVKRLRSTLEPDRPARTSSALLPTVGTGYALHIDAHAVDVLRFRDLAAQARTARDRGDIASVRRLCHDGLRLFHAAPCADIPLLAGSPRLTALHSERQSVVGWLLDAALNAGSPEEALTAVEQAALAQPLDELAQARLLRLYQALGRRADAFTAFDHTRRQLRESLGVDPGAELRQAYAALLSDQPAAGIVTVTAPTQPSSPTHTFAVSLARIGRAAQALPHGGIVNVVGPVGIGKTTLLADCRPVYASIVDQADSNRAVARMLSTRSANTVTIVASRRPLLAQPSPLGVDWPPTVTVQLAPWTDDEIRALATVLGITGRGQLNVVTRLSGGLPLIADRLCRALHRGISADSGGALADAAVTEVLHRIRSECRRPLRPDLIATLAAIGQGDQELLPADDFDDLAQLSVVAPAEHGLCLIEPYRTLFDLVHRWRTPTAHRRAVAGALTHRRDLLTVATGSRRASLVEQGLWLTGIEDVRSTLFPPRTTGNTVRRSTAADAEAIARLTRRWAQRGGLDPRRSDRIIGSWLAADPGGFQVAINSDGEVIGTIGALAMTDRTRSLVEPLLQRHDPDFVEPGGVFVGMAYADDRAAQASLLRSVLAQGIATGRVVVSTFWPEYQRLTRALGFRHHGDGEDVYRCGRPLQVFAHAFADTDVPAWLDRLSLLGLGRPAETWHARLVRQAMRQPSGTHLRNLAHAGIEALAASSDPEHAAAGALLASCYLHRLGHVQTARALGISRATYLRRLRRCIGLLADFLAASTAA